VAIVGSALSSYTIITWAINTFAIKLGFVMKQQHSAVVVTGGTGNMDPYVADQHVEQKVGGLRLAGDLE